MRAAAIVGSVCTGAMLLAATGITAGRPATTHHLAIEDLRASRRRDRRGPRRRRRRHHDRRRRDLRARPRAAPRRAPPAARSPSRSRARSSTSASRPTARPGAARSDRRGRTGTSALVGLLRLGGRVRRSSASRVLIDGRSRRLARRRWPPPLCAPALGGRRAGRLRAAEWLPEALSRVGRSLIFGLQWLRKASLRSSRPQGRSRRGRSARSRCRPVNADERLGLDWFGFVVASGSVPRASRS